MRPRRGKIFIAKNIYQHRFDPYGVVPHLNKIFYKYLIPSGLSKTSKKKNLIITDKNRLKELIKAGDNGLLVERILYKFNLGYINIYFFQFANKKTLAFFPLMSLTKPTELVSKPLVFTNKITKSFTLIIFQNICFKKIANGYMQCFCNLFNIGN